MGSDRGCCGGHDQVGTFDTWNVLDAYGQFPADCIASENQTTTRTSLFLEKLRYTGTFGVTTTNSLKLTIEVCCKVLE